MILIMPCYTAQHVLWVEDKLGIGQPITHFT